ncbi:MAG: PspC domain-containing protein [Planctomycetota bacterium]|jgi:phage shock protein C
MARRKATKRRISRRTTRRRPSPKVHRLYRSGSDRIIGGVCGGIAEYLKSDPTIIRLLWVIGTLAWGAGLLAYIIAWIIIPRNPDHRW